MGIPRGRLVAKVGCSESVFFVQLLTEKACDLCFTKKIKCDMLKPVCSNCVLYQSECRTSIIRRKPNAAKARQAARVQREEEYDPLAPD